MSNLERSSTADSQGLIILNCSNRKLITSETETSATTPSVDEATSKPDAEQGMNRAKNTIQ